jgi:hypothetical protein
MKLLLIYRISWTPESKSALMKAFLSPRAQLCRCNRYGFYWRRLCQIPSRPVGIRHWIVTRGSIEKQRGAQLATGTVKTLFCAGWSYPGRET